MAAKGSLKWFFVCAKNIVSHFSVCSCSLFLSFFFSPRFRWKDHTFSRSFGRLIFMFFSRISSFFILSNIVFDWILISPICCSERTFLTLKIEIHVSRSTIWACRWLLRGSQQTMVNCIGLFIRVLFSLPFAWFWRKLIDIERWMDNWLAWNGTVAWHQTAHAFVAASRRSSIASVQRSKFDEENNKYKR